MSLSLLTKRSEGVAAFSPGPKNEKPEAMSSTLKDQNDSLDHDRHRMPAEPPSWLRGTWIGPCAGWCSRPMRTSSSGLDRADDAGVYKISDDLALIQTVDFFTPIVDDPYAFGQIAAANALSDVYAMGGTPKTAMNLVAFPVKEMDISILRRIIQGGVDKLTEAGVVLVGGHSIEDKELKYGLSVTGFVHPQRVLTKKNLQAGDRLVLTKPLGTGIVNTAIKAGMAPAGLVERVTGLMAALNRTAAEVMAGFDVHACTDVTGFGLLGHLAEMVSRLRQGGAGLFAKRAGDPGSPGFCIHGAHTRRRLQEQGIPRSDGRLQDRRGSFAAGCAFRSPDLGRPADRCTRRPGRQTRGVLGVRRSTWIRRDRRSAPRTGREDLGRLRSDFSPNTSKEVDFKIPLTPFAKGGNGRKRADRLR